MRRKNIHFRHEFDEMEAKTDDTKHNRNIQKGKTLHILQRV